MKRLQVDYIDLFFCHRPDKETPIEETVWAMNSLIQQGKILYWGTSEWNASEIMEAILVAEKNHLIGPTMEQPQYNMIHREKMEKEFLHLFKHHGIGTTIWSPLASGLLTGKYSGEKKDNTRLDIEGMDWLKKQLLVEENLKRVDETKIIADKLNTMLPLLGIAWCLKNPNVSSVILGASKTSQLTENLKALELLPLMTQEIMNEVDSVWKTKPVQAEY